MKKEYAVKDVVVGYFVFLDLGLLFHFVLVMYYSSIPAYIIVSHHAATMQMTFTVYLCIWNLITLGSITTAWSYFHSRSSFLWKALYKWSKFRGNQLKLIWWIKTWHPFQSNVPTSLYILVMRIKNARQYTHFPAPKYFQVYPLSSHAATMQMAFTVYLCIWNLIT